MRLARGSNIIRGCLGTIARILSETHSYYNDWVVIDNSIDIFESNGVTEESDGLYYNGIKIASFIRDGVWIRENAEDYHQVPLRMLELALTTFLYMSALLYAKTLLFIIKTLSMKSHREDNTNENFAMFRN